MYSAGHDVRNLVMTCTPLFSENSMNLVLPARNMRLTASTSFFEYRRLRGKQEWHCSGSEECNCIGKEEWYCISKEGKDGGRGHLDALLQRQGMLTKNRHRLHQSLVTTGCQLPTLLPQPEHP